VTKIHPTAIVAPEAELAEAVEVGPYTIIGPQVRIGAGTRIGPYVLLEGATIIGEKCDLSAASVLGGLPQDDKYKGEPTQVIIGDETKIREYVTIHRATGEGNATRVGNHCHIMAYSHLAHNCQVGNGVSIANYGGMSGHTVIEDNAVIGGMVGSHQFVRVGRLAMVSGFSKISVDVPPFTLADGKPAEPVGLNVRGLRRAGVEATERVLLAKAFKILYRSNLNLSQALEQLTAFDTTCPELQYLIDFLQASRSGYAGRGNDPAGRRHV
jgi:UDP-N-acetylglucosamine acyltransferase